MTDSPPKYVSTELLSILANDELSKNYMNAQIPNIPNGKGKGKDKSKDDSEIPFPGDPGLLPEIPLYTPQQYWEDLVRRRPMTPDFRGHNKIRCAYNTDPIPILYSGTIRHPPPKGQNPTLPGVLDVPSIFKTHQHSRSRDGNAPEYFNPFFQYSFGAGQDEHE